MRVYKYISLWHTGDTWEMQGIHEKGKKRLLLSVISESPMLQA